MREASAKTLCGGDYSYQATYNGNANYKSKTSDCEPFKISKATPGISTIVKDSNGNTVEDRKSVVLGKSVDLGARRIIKKRTLSFDGTATVTYSFFTHNDCTTPAD